MKKITILLFLAVFMFCGSKEKESSISPPENEPQEHEHLELRLSLEKQKEWNIEIGEVSETTVSSRITLPGVLALDQNKTATISSFAEGKVLSISADLGDLIRKGQILLTINSPEFAQAQADFLQARTRLNLNRKEFERAKMLLQEKAIEQKEYLRRESEHEKAMTEVGVLGSKLHSFGLEHHQINELIDKCESLDQEEYLCEVANPNLTILSPITGKIIFRDIIVGEHIKPEKTLFTVSNLTTLWALLDAYEKDLPFINKESRVRIQSTLYPNKHFEGKINYISETIDEKLRTIKIRVEVSNKESLLKPNMFILGTIEIENRKEKYFTVPEQAVQSLNGKKVVFLQEDTEIFVPQEVTIKETIDTKAVVSEGLQLGQKIVINGAFYLKAELNKESFGEAHVH